MFYNLDDSRQTIRVTVRLR